MPKSKINKEKLREEIINEIIEDLEVEQEPVHAYIQCFERLDLALNNMTDDDGNYILHEDFKELFEALNKHKKTIQEGYNYYEQELEKLENAVYWVERSEREKIIRKEKNNDFK